MARLAAVVRWCGGRRRRQRCGGTRTTATVWLGGGRRRLAVSRLLRWRLVAQLLQPIRKALMNMAHQEGPQRQPQQQQLPPPPPLMLSFPFVGTLSIPAVVVA
ncbi:hypothetical protein BRADI_5g24825v3 [Brachypodium distachyon]|uniref:Uncharacterized protein n=1 Tax=Brachypodium distachyon TaxID=15368 RepID=A0A0Q3P7U1_BRADI|nr:hypothetical protein BRADI_5g24825v3 [Brachypodium distachyon]